MLPSLDNGPVDRCETLESVTVGEYVIAISHSSGKYSARISSNNVMIAEMYENKGEIFVSRIYAPVRFDALEACSGAIACRLAPAASSQSHNAAAVKRRPLG